MRNGLYNFRRAPRPARGFTLIEVLIVVAILGILGAMVLPRFSDASQVARQNTLKDELRYLRTQVTVFRAQHRDVSPGYPNGNTSATPSAADFIAQMTGTTDEYCKTGAPSPTFRLGPYLTQMPANPVNNKDTIKIVATGQPMPAPDGSSGWIYRPQTLEIIPNLTGTDTNGTRFSDY